MIRKQEQQSWLRDQNIHRTNGGIDVTASYSFLPRPCVSRMSHYYVSAGRVAGTAHAAD